ncbi:hypothetical protein [Pedobacter frigiditerrae]|uniref:hypothetical protein n=1 Tax=Pedobacter frigiditerrae TaxID=2530452 RepID=UPI00292E4B84|nr:hypothetical protein [Pedobacter frigiditerrae]
MAIITIKQLQQDISTRFKSENSYTYFGIDTINYEFKFNSLLITVGHFTNNNLYYRFTFKDVIAYTVIEEFFLKFNEKEEFETFAFFGISKNSNFKNNIAPDGLFEPYLDGKLEIKTYRIFAQNNFIDIITKIEPLIEV